MCRALIRSPGSKQHTQGRSTPAGAAVCCSSNLDGSGESPGVPRGLARRGGRHGKGACSLPRMAVMVAAGGVNSAGRTSRRHAYRRMVWDHLSADDRAGTESALAQMMGTQDSSLIRHHTLVREIEADWFDHRAVPWHARFAKEAGHRLAEGGGEELHLRRGKGTSLRHGVMASA